MLTHVFERFTDRSRQVLVLAQEEARLLNHNFIGTEHVLLGLIHEGEGVAAMALDSLGVTLGGVRVRVEETIGPAGSVNTGSPPFTPRAKKVLELSLREAMQMGHKYIGTEHLLLGLLREGEGVATQVLLSLGANLERVRQEVIQLLSGYGSKGSAEGARTSGASEQVGGWSASSGVRPPGAGGMCFVCGRDLWEVQRYVIAGRVKICESCVSTAAEVVKAAEREGRGPELRLPPRVFGAIPDEHAVDQIVIAFERVFGGAASDADRARFLEDADGLRRYEEEGARRHGERLAGCRVDRVGFTGADRARVRFEIALTSGGTYPMDGTAVRREGQWKVSRETQAGLLRRGGVQVPPAPNA